MELCRPNLARRCDAGGRTWTELKVCESRSRLVDCHAPFSFRNKMKGNPPKKKRKKIKAPKKNGPSRNELASRLQLGKSLAAVPLNFLKIF